MKKFFFKRTLTLVVLSTLCSLLFAVQAPALPSTIDSKRFTKLSEVVSYVGSQKVTCVLTTKLKTNGDTVPATLVLAPVHGGGLIKDTGGVTINGPVVDPGSVQWLYGVSAGDVTGLKEARPEWTGADQADDTDDDTTAFQTAVSAAKKVLLSNATYNISGVTTTDGTDIEGIGANSIVKVNSLASNYAVGYRGASVKTGLALRNFAVDGNKALGTFTGTGHGIDILNYTNVTIEQVEIKNAKQHGIRIQDSNNVYVGWSSVHHCDKYGITIEGTESPATLSTGLHLDHNSATYNGWTGLAFGDTGSNWGWRNIILTGLYSGYNSKDGVAFGRNATGGDYGAQDVVFDTLELPNNGNHGAEFFGSRKIVGGSINAPNNAYHGVYFALGDDLATQVEDVAVDSVMTEGNGYHGVYISAAKNLSIGRIITKNNSQASSGTYSGLSMYGNNDATKLGNIHIGALLTYDDQGSPTQKYGYEMQAGATLGNIHIGYLRAYGNVTRDAWFGTATISTVDKMIAGTWGPRYSDAGGPSVQVSLENNRIGSGQTTDATPTDIISLSLPVDSLTLIEAVITGKTSDEATLANYIVRATIKRAGSGFSALQGTPAASYAEETNAALDGTIYVTGADGKAYIRVTGLASTTIDWHTKVKVTSLPF